MTDVMSLNVSVLSRTVITNTKPSGCPTTFLSHIITRATSDGVSTDFFDFLPPCNYHVLFTNRNQNMEILRKFYDFMPFLILIILSWWLFNLGSPTLALLFPKQTECFLIWPRCVGQVWFQELHRVCHSRCVSHPWPNILREIISPHLVVNDAHVFEVVDKVTVVAGNSRHVFRGELSCPPTDPDTT